jgi:hypothetical protein
MNADLFRVFVDFGAVFKAALPTVVPPVDPRSPAVAVQQGSTPAAAFSSDEGARQ